MEGGAVMHQTSKKIRISKELVRDDLVENVEGQVELGKEEEKKTMRSLILVIDR